MMGVALKGRGEGGIAGTRLRRSVPSLSIHLRARPGTLKWQSNRDNRQGTGGRDTGQEKVVVEEEVVVQHRLWWLRAFDGGGGIHWRQQGMMTRRWRGGRGKLEDTDAIIKSN